MKVRLMYLLVAFVAAGALGAAQGALKLGAPTFLPQDPQTPKPDIMLTGCVTQGSAPAVFILDNAKVNPGDQKEKGKVYLLVPDMEDLALSKQVNHEVTVTGVPEAKPAPTVGQKIVEKELPKFSAKSLVLVADKCQGTTR